MFNKSVNWLIRAIRGIKTNLQSLSTKEAKKKKPPALFVLAEINNTIILNLD